MCLNEQVKFTFSNGEAFERAVEQIVGRFGSKHPEGVIYYDIGFRCVTVFPRRDKDTYEKLVELLKTGRISAKKFEVHGHTDLQMTVVKLLGTRVFGEITVEVR